MYFSKLNGYDVKDKEAREYIDELRNTKADRNIVDTLLSGYEQIEQQNEELVRSNAQLQEDLNSLQLLNENLTSKIGNISNPNLLINGDFKINQEGLTSVTSTNADRKYLFDQWFTCDGNTSNNRTLEKVSNGLKISGTGNVGIAYQKLENLQEGVYTLSAKIDGSIYEATFNWNNSYIDKGFDNGVSLIMTMVDNLPTVAVALTLSKKSSANVEWVKLEQGSIATPFVPRLHGEELLLCQRYFQNFQTLLAPLLFENYTTGSSLIVREMLVVPMRTTPIVKSNDIYNRSSAKVAKINTSSLNSELMAHITLDTNLTAGVYFLFATLDARL